MQVERISADITLKHKPKTGTQAYNMKKAQELREMEKKLALNMDIIKYFTLAWKSKLSVISSLAKKKRVQSDIVRPFTFAKL